MKDLTPSAVITANAVMLECGSGAGAPAAHRQCGRMCQRLVHDAVPLRQAQEGSKLFFRGVGVKRELKSYVLEADWNFLGQTKCSSEVEVAFSLKRGIS